MAERSYEAASGGGMVKAEVSGKQELRKLVIDPKALEGGDVEMLQDLILAAVNEAGRHCPRNPGARDERYFRRHQTARRILSFLIMHSQIPEPLKALVEQLARLPGLGPKSAMRVAMTLLKWPEAETRRLGRGIHDLRDNLASLLALRRAFVRRSLRGLRRCGTDPRRALPGHGVGQHADPG